MLISDRRKCDSHAAALALVEASLELAVEKLASCRLSYVITNALLVPPWGFHQITCHS